MRNVDIQLASAPAAGEAFELRIRDSSTGLPIADLWFSRIQLGGLVAGNVVAGELTEHAAPSGPMKRETMEQSVQAPMLPDDKASRDHVIAELLRPYEQFGWKANRAHLGDKNRIERTLAGGIVLYRVEFERFLPEPARG